MNLSPAALRRIVPFAAFMAILALRGYAPVDGVGARLSMTAKLQILKSG